MTNRKIAGHDVREWKIAGVLGVIGLFFLAYLMFSGPRETAKVTLSPEQQQAVAAKAAIENAYWACRDVIRKVARDPSSVDVPRINPYQIGNADWRFLWGPKSELIKMKNGLGLEVSSPALCVVDAYTGVVTSLFIDGKPLITDGG